MVLFFLVTGCATLFGNYGKTKYLRNTDDPTTIQDLIDNWENYDIHYSGRGVKLPLGIMFDPKGSDTTLTGERWYKVEDQETLIEITKWIYVFTSYEPELSQILGPDGRFYGYLYPSYGFMILKQTGDNEMFAFELKEPQEEGDGGPFN
jgi:hypothetical protein